MHLFYLLQVSYNATENWKKLQNLFTWSVSHYKTLLVINGLGSDRHIHTNMQTKKSDGDWFKN